MSHRVYCPSIRSPHKPNQYFKIAFFEKNIFQKKIVIFGILVIFTVLHTLKIDFFGSAGEIST